MRPCDYYLFRQKINWLTNSSKNVHVQLLLDNLSKDKSQIAIIKM